VSKITISLCNLQKKKFEIYNFIPIQKLEATRQEKQIKCLRGFFGNGLAACTRA
jgi:hypothetical protein